MDIVCTNIFNVAEHLVTWVVVRKKWAFLCWDLNNFPMMGELDVTITNITLLAGKVGTSAASLPVNGCAVPGVSTI